MAETKITIQLTLTAMPGAPRIPLEISNNISCSELRQESSKVTKIPIGSIKLIVRGRMIADDSSKQAVTEFKLEEGSVLHVLGKPVDEDLKLPATGNETTTTTTPTVTTSNVSTISSTQIQPSAASITETDPLKAALQKLRSSNSQSTYQTAVTTLEKILTNIADNPMEEKYRKVKKQNPAFQRRLGGIPGGHELIEASGLLLETKDGEEAYVLNASADAWPQLLTSRATMVAYARDAKSSSAQPSLIPSAGSGSLPFGMGGINPGPGSGGIPNFMPPSGAIGGVDPLARLLSDPNGIQTMMQVNYILIILIFFLYNIFSTH